MGFNLTFKGLNIIILSALMYFKLSLYFELIHNFLCTFYLVFHEGNNSFKYQNTLFLSS